MEFPSSLGLPEEILVLLKAVGVNGEPIWSIRHVVGKVYLDLCWSLNSPAKKTPQAPEVSKESTLKPSQVSSSLDVPVVDSRKSRTKRKKKKKKSPSTLRRDKKRYNQWLASRPNPNEAQVTQAKVELSVTQDVPVTVTQDVPVTNSEPTCQLETSTIDILVPTTGDLDIQSDLLPTTEVEFDQEDLSNSGSSDSDLDLDLDPCDIEHHCWSCLQPESCFKEPLKKCTRCKTARYCSRDCQAKDWKHQHKTVCQNLSEYQKLSA